MEEELNDLLTQAQENISDNVDKRRQRSICRNKRLLEREVMKKYRVNVVGTKYVTTDTEDKAIEHTQDMLDHIHKSLNMQVFSIAEVREE